MTTAVLAPSWLPDGRITVAQLASGILEHAEQFTSGTLFRLPYPANLQSPCGGSHLASQVEEYLLPSRINTIGEDNDPETPDEEPET
jgi:hypothetical protein